MNAVVFEHVLLSELPAAWRAKLPKRGFARASQVTVRIEQEAKEAQTPSASAQAQAALNALKTNPLVGMWADRQDLTDVPGYVRALRTPRLNADGSRRKKAAE